MNRRPRSVTVISCIFLAAGVIGFAYHASEFKTQGPFQYDLIWVCLVRLLAIICAVFMLRARNWARWTLIVWITYHVILGAFHSAFQAVVHGLLLAVIVYFLFNRRAEAYFRGGTVHPEQDPKMDDQKVA